MRGSNNFEGNYYMIFVAYDFDMFLGDNWMDWSYYLGKNGFLDIESYLDLDNECFFLLGKSNSYNSY